MKSDSMNEYVLLIEAIKKVPLIRSLVQKPVYQLPSFFTGNTGMFMCQLLNKVTIAALRHEKGGQDSNVIPVSRKCQYKQTVAFQTSLEQIK